MAEWNRAEGFDYEPDQANERNPGGSGAMTLKCIGIKADGLPCEALPLPGSDYCYGHDPSYSQERHLNAVRGNRIAGRGRPSLTQEYVHIREKIQALTTQVLDGTLDP